MANRLSRQIIELHDGTLDLESTLGEGTVVTITLPLAGAKTNAAGGKKAPPDGSAKDAEKALAAE